MKSHANNWWNGIILSKLFDYATCNIVIADLGNQYTSAIPWPNWGILKVGWFPIKPSFLVAMKKERHRYILRNETCWCKRSRKPCVSIYLFFSSYSTLDFRRNKGISVGIRFFYVPLRMTGTWCQHLARLAEKKKGLIWTNTSVSGAMFLIHCMVYLPTFTIKNNYKMRGYTKLLLTSA